jgi:hypothetical protein
VGCLFRHVANIDWELTLENVSFKMVWPEKTSAKLHGIHSFSSPHFDGAY